MEAKAENKLGKIIVIGDKVLIKSRSLSEKTKTGLYLPPGVQEKEIVQSGYVMKSGPGYPLPVNSEDELWKKSDDKVRYVPLQVKEGDLAIFLQRDAVEVIYESEKYFIVPQNSILLIERDEGFFE